MQENSLRHTTLGQSSWNLSCFRCEIILSFISGMSAARGKINCEGSIDRPSVRFDNTRVIVFHFTARDGNALTRRFRKPGRLGHATSAHVSRVALSVCLEIGS